MGFAVRNNLLNTIQPGSNGSKRLLTIRLNTNAGPVTFVRVYAPTLSATPDIKDEFYDKLATTISIIPSKDQLVLLGDFNAKVGADHDSWPSCLGQQDERQRSETARAMHLPQLVHSQLLQDQAPAQGLLETSTLKALAPAGSYSGQTIHH
ncbi:unnamed protein product [Acanthosepion pharaonis]|uniref:Endonuclease/exonuclease/phosphatase domain-containing protein n=1 Tax=Acanthosepion pharaonis TaxID=158019 RepID=A0A812DBA9_ACAPH|nr:unnamed protein product [Sepia pharaonis]